MITRVNRCDFPPGFRCARSFRTGGQLVACDEHPEFEVWYVAGHALFFCSACKDEAVLEGLAAA